MATGFFWDEKCFWHSGGQYALTMPVGGFVQPMAGGLAESPETKRRMKNLMDVSGLSAELDMRSAPMADMDALLRVHPAFYLDEFKTLSDAGGGELGHHAPFGKGSFEIAALSAGLASEAVRTVLAGDLENAYALSRPPGHHCLPNGPQGFCLLANIAIALEAARASNPGLKIAVVDWDVHHGNGTEAIYYDRADTLTISLHQEGNYPINSGYLADRGEGSGQGFNVNLPMYPGSGHAQYLHAMNRVVEPALRAFEPDLIVVACGFDAAAPDPLSTMLATEATFHDMTLMIKDLANDQCGGKLVLVHEGGYSEAYVPFCGHSTLQALSGSAIKVDDPLGVGFKARQPNPKFSDYLNNEINDMAIALGL